MVEAAWIGFLGYQSLFCPKISEGREGVDLTFCIGSLTGGVGGDHFQG